MMDRTRPCTPTTAWASELSINDAKMMASLPHNSFHLTQTAMHGKYREGLVKFHVPQNTFENNQLGYLQNNQLEPMNGSNFTI